MWPSIDSGPLDTQISVQLRLQTIEQNHEETNDETDALVTPTMANLAQLIREKKPNLDSSILIIGSEGDDILIERNEVTMIPSNTRSASCHITIPNGTLAKILTKKQRWVDVFTHILFVRDVIEQNIWIHVDYTVQTLKDLSRFEFARRIVWGRTNSEITNLQ